MSLTLDDFDYALPPDRIAQAPLDDRSASRLLVLNGGTIADQRFDDLGKLLLPGDLLVFNDTRVLHARLRGHKQSGGQVEVLIERILGANEALAQIRASKSPRAGTRLSLDGGLDAQVLGRKGDFFELLFETRGPLLEVLERHGQLPLPPYIAHAADAHDEERYQTVFARNMGSVAAPTAGLHFDQALLRDLAQRGIQSAFLTLHVGAGTFQPVRTRDLSQHTMHSERYFLPAETVRAIDRTRKAGGRVIAVGTTSLRTLEAAARCGPLAAGEGETDLFITPGFEFRIADRLLTNFHLPKSTLLMLVSAFAGMDPIREAYQHAIDAGYRFFSYGDAMLLTRQA